MKASPRYRAVFISDAHLGSSGCRAAELASFLKRVRTDNLYLVGDIIDMWRLRQRWFWPEKHNRVITRLLKHARRGTRVLYIPGNHDEYARRYKDLEFGGIRIVLEAEHTTARGERLLVTHGDQFDLIIKHARMLSVIGAWGYDTLVVINNRLNWVRKRLGLDHWSLSMFVKSRVKTACQYIGKFEDVLSEEANRRGFDGVVCGHIHHAEIRSTHQQVLYVNCGDWVESCTAVAEHLDGRLELINVVDWLANEKEHKRKRRRLRSLNSDEVILPGGPPRPAISQPAAHP